MGSAKLTTLYLCILALFTGCVATSQSDVPRTTPQSHQSSTSNLLYTRPPDCALVLRTLGAQPRVARMIEHVVTRHLRDRISRVIGPEERDSSARSNVHDLDDPIDLARFTHAQRCASVVRILVNAHNHSYAVAFAQRRLELTLVLEQPDTNTVLWQSTDALDRSAGGLPTGPLSLVLDSWKATNFAGDQEGTEALAEDLIRRMIRRLPDLS